MPSPFPGMNPYMESPSIWPGVHNRLITALGNEINRAAPPNYFADIEERVFLLRPSDPYFSLMIPDVTIKEMQAPG